MNAVTVEVIVHADERSSAPIRGFEILTMFLQKLPFSFISLHIFWSILIELIKLLTFWMIQYQIETRG